MEKNYEYLQGSNHTAASPQKLSNTFIQIFISIHITVAVLAFFGNILVCVAISCFRALKAPCFLVVASLASANLLMVLVFVFRMILITNWREHMPFDCHILSEVNLAVLCVLLLHVSAMVFERFLAIKCALRYKVFVTRLRVFISIFLLWIIGAAGAFCVQFIPYIFTISDHESYTIFHESFYHCVHIADHRHEVHASNHLLQNPYLLFLDVFYFLVPLIIILACSNYLYNAACHQDERLEQEANMERKMQKKYQMKLTKTFGIVVIMFLASVLPHLVAAVYLHFHPGALYDEETAKRMRILMILSSVGACGCLNPIVYACKIRSFRKSFRRLLLPCKRKRANKKPPAKIESRERVCMSRISVETQNGRTKLWSENDWDLF